ncbi:MAG TPA: hypothetical protein VI112_04525 [Bacteroidia bacterium]|jgi:hypothetical protein
MVSPFVFGKVVVNKQFANRKADIFRLSSNFRNKVNSVIIAPRRWGKSSLIQQTISELSQMSFYNFCFLDLFRIRTEQDFYRYYVNEVIRCTSKTFEERIATINQYLFRAKTQLALGITADNEFDVQFEFNQKFNDDVLQVGSEIAKKKHITLVVCIDNFQNIVNFQNSISFQRKLRASWEGQDRVVFCLYGSRRSQMNDIFTNPDMPFYGFGDLMYLDKIPAPEFSFFIQSLFTDTGKTISKIYSDRIVELMESHPFYVQQLAHIVWTHTDKLVNEDVFKKAVEELTERNLLLFQKGFDSLSNQQVSFLKALIDEQNLKFTSKDTIHKYNLQSSAGVIRAIEGLEKKDIIDRFNGNITFSDPAFKLWLKDFLKVT